MSQHADLFTRSSLGFVRVAAISPELRVADVTFNTQCTIDAMAAAIRARQIALAKAEAQAAAIARKGDNHEAD